MSDRIGEQILVESYKVLYDYIAMNESEDTKFNLQIRTFKKIEKSICNEAKSMDFSANKLRGNKEKLEEPMVVLLNPGRLFDFYEENENDALELLKMASSNDTDGLKNTEHTGLWGSGDRKGIFILKDVDGLVTAATGDLPRWNIIEDDKLGDDKYKKFILRAFPVWVKSARKILSTINKYSKD